MKCPRCKKEVNSLTGAAEGFHDNVTKKMWGSFQEITGRDDMVCRPCFNEIRMQDPEYAKKMKEHEDHQKYNALIDAMKGGLETKG